jgi:hypothetical protein
MRANADMRAIGFPLLSALAVLASACSSGPGSESGSEGTDGSVDFDASSTGDAAGAGASSGAGSSSSSDAAGSGASSGAGSSSSDSGSDASPGAGDAGTGRGDAAACVRTDTCPAPNGGITFDCEKRFLFGENYAWQNWGTDFGGGSSGVAGNSATVKAALQDMQSHGADVIRWWMFQELNGNNGVELDSNGIPTGNARGTLAADIKAALSLAAQVGVHYNFTLFSFDNFVLSSGRHDLAPIITSDTKRAKLMQFVAVVAQTVESDPNKDRVVSWDVINEPEWALGGIDGDVDASVSTGMDPYGDPAFNGGSAGKVYDLVTFAQMETFVKDTVTALHQKSSALVTVGSAAAKWKDAWKHVGLDYYTVHMYDWVNQYYPYTTPVASYGFTLPVVMGEFPNAGLMGVPYATLLNAIYGKSIGYAGAMSWAYTDKSFPWTGSGGGAANEQAFAASAPCVTKF